LSWYSCLCFHKVDASDDGDFAAVDVAIAVAVANGYVVAATVGFQAAADVAVEH